MNPITYCREVANLLTEYDEEKNGYDRDKFLVSTDRMDALLANGCLPELFEPTTTGFLISVSPQQVVDYVTDAIKEGRSSWWVRNTTGEFAVGEHPRLILLLLANPGLAKLIKLERTKE